MYPKSSCKFCLQKGCGRNNQNKGSRKHGVTYGVIETRQMLKPQTYVMEQFFLLTHLQSYALVKPPTLTTRAYNMCRVCAYDTLHGLTLGSYGDFFGSFLTTSFALKVDQTLQIFIIFFCFFFCSIFLLELSLVVQFCEK